MCPGVTRLQTQFNRSLTAWWMNDKDSMSHLTRPASDEAERRVRITCRAETEWLMLRFYLSNQIADGQAAVGGGGAVSQSLPSAECELKAR